MRFFLTSILLQNIETNEGGPLVQSKNFQKSLIVPKKLSEKHQDIQRILSMFSRFWASVLFPFVLDEVLRFRVLNLRSSVVEQMNKKWTLPV